GPAPEDICPDAPPAGKALGGGVVPVSAVLASRETFAPFARDPFLHTATFSGQPLLMAAVQGAIRAIQEEHLVSRSLQLGASLLPEINRIVRDNCADLVADVRGQGLMIGVELVEAGLAAELLVERLNNGVVANHSMIGSSVVRFTPPAILTDRDVDFFLDALARACHHLMDKRARMPEGW